MGAMRDAVKLAVLGKCQRCRGTGQEAHYDQAAEVIKKGRIVGCTDMTAYRRCTACRGSGKAR